MAYKNDQDRIEKTHNAPRLFVEHPQVSWVLLVGVLVWGWFGYHSMPQRKDPDIPVRVAVAFCSWPGATAQQVEQFVTRPIEDAVAENKTIHPGTASDYGVRSVSLLGAVQLFEQQADEQSILHAPQMISGSGFIAVDCVSDEDDASIHRFVEAFFQEQLQRSDLHPDGWTPIIIRDPHDVRATLTDVAGDKYSYADLDNFSDLIGRTVQGAP